MIIIEDWGGVCRACEAVFVSIAHRSNGLFARILRCFPLQSVRIAAENRLVCGQKFSSFGAPCLRKQLQIIRKTQK